MSLPQRFARRVNRRTAFSDSSPGIGERTAAAADTQFVLQYMPLAWNALIPVFGSQVDYWLKGDPATSTTITIMWKEGQAEEVFSPGRYSRATIRYADLPRQPLKGDTVVKNGTLFDVVDVHSSAVAVCQVVLQSQGVLDAN